MKFLILFISSVMVLSSCVKEELPVPKHDPGNIITNTVNMGSNYKWQVYFNLKNNTVVGENLKTSWDLGFETSSDGYRIILNSSKAMYAAKTNQTDFSLVTDTIGFSATKDFDSPTGNMEQTAIGDWRLIPNQVYLIDRGYNELGSHQGFRKIVFESVSDYSYAVRFSQLNGSGETTLQIPKDVNYNFTFFSFTTSSTVMVEPPKIDWDIVFTQYLEELSTPYLVTGCLLNKYKTMAKADSITAFNSINYDFALSQLLSSNINVIGYDWKEYNFTTSSYLVSPNKNYIIQDQNGFYYKLHFIDFYNNSGIKGNPTFEFQKL
ncbi:MAG: hypothetical protein HYU68_10720 [Bacteroidetes bacterium]|nr:hypothetical protein [Bacteroidota bacterium]